MAVPATANRRILRFSKLGAGLDCYGCSKNEILIPHRQQRVWVFFLGTAVGGFDILPGVGASKGSSSSAVHGISCQENFPGYCFLHISILSYHTLFLGEPSLSREKLDQVRRRCIGCIRCIRCISAWFVMCYVYKSACACMQFTGYQYGVLGLSQNPTWFHLDSALRIVYYKQLKGSFQVWCFIFPDTVMMFPYCGAFEIRSSICVRECSVGKVYCQR